MRTTNQPCAVWPRYNTDRPAIQYRAPGTGRYRKLRKTRADSAFGEGGYRRGRRERGGCRLHTERVAIRQKIIKAGSLASVFKDQDAAAILGELETATSDMPPRLRAAFCNLNGVLAIHNDELEKATAHFEAASALNPNEPQIAINLLTVQHSLTQKDASRWPLPDDWDRRLDELLHKKPDLVSGIRLKMWRRSPTTGVKSADDFLLSSSISGVGREEALIALAEFHMFDNDPGGALDLLESIENPRRGMKLISLASRPIP